MTHHTQLAPLVLVADDNETKRYTVVRTLMKGGYRVIEAENGKEALEKAVNRLPDLMVVDIKMPDMSGFEVCREIKNNAATASIPLLHFSATINTPAARVHGLEEGADAFLTQDANPEELLATVKALLRMRHAEMELRRQNERLRIISQAAEHLLASNSPETMVKDLFQKVGEHLRIDTYFNFMVNEQGDALILDSYAGISEETAHELERLEFGQALCGMAALTIEPVVAFYIQQSDDPKADLLRRLGIRAYVCNPLAVGKRLLGTLSFAARDRDSFSEGDLEFLRTICHYVSLAKEKQEMLRKAQSSAKALQEANRRKDDFLANMSHEIRTPMNAVLGLSYILTKSKPLTQKQHEYIDTLQVSAQSLLSLINDLLDIAKIESQNVELEDVPFDLKELVEEVAAISSVKANEKGIALNGSYDAYVHQFSGDPTRLKQVLINMVANAIKFTEKGEVGIAVSLISEKEDICFMAIRVTDTGIGIPEDKLTSIFGKFSQGDTSISRKYGGTGLGLAIAKTLVELMGGEISVTSQVGRGSQFSITVPLRHVEQPTLALKAECPIRDPKEVTEDAPLILLVEDYQANILVATTWLHNLGYRYEVAHNGKEAVHKAANTAFDAVLMDVQMPDIDGFAATRIIRENEKKCGRSSVPIIGLTAYASKDDKKKCLAAGMDDYISKPLNPVEFETKIAGFLQLKAA